MQVSGRHLIILAITEINSIAAYKVSGGSDADIRNSSTVQYSIPSHFKTDEI